MSDPRDRQHDEPAVDPTPAGESWARLRASDPVEASAAPDLSDLRRRVLAYVDIVGDEPAADRGPASRAAGHPHSRAIRTVGAVAAGVVLLAGAGLAGVAVGRSADGPGPTAASVYVMPAVNAPEVAADSPAPGMPESAGTPEPGRMAGDAAISSMPWSGGRVLLTPAPGLPDDGGTASGYLLNGSGIDARDAAVRLAGILGVQGRPVPEGESWVVGRNDGSSPTLVVTGGAFPTWYFDDPQASPWACPAEPDPGPGPAESGSDKPEPGPAGPEGPVDCTRPAGESPSEREAERRAREAFGAAGFDVDSARWSTSSEPTDRGRLVSVTATATVGGGSTGMAWGAQFGPEGLFSASGFLATVTEVPGYPVVGARTATLRSLDPRWSTVGPTPVYREGDPIPLAGSVAGGDDAASSSVTSSAMSAGPSHDGRPVLVATVDEATVTDATLDLTQYWQQDGSLLLLPAYLLTGADGRAWSMVAVTDDYVRFSAAPIG